MKKTLISFVTGLFLLFSLSLTAFAGACQDLDYNISDDQDAICTADYDACLANPPEDVYQCSYDLADCCEAASDGFTFDDPVDDQPTTTGLPILYSNSDYGFQLSLPTTWSSYEVLTETLGEYTYLTFYLPSTEVISFSMFSIGITTGQVSEYEEYLGSNSSYNFTFTHPNGQYPTDLQPLIADFDQIKASFFTFEIGGGTGVTGAFSDTGGHIYDSSIQYVKDQGIVQGYDDGTYKPDNPINRAEFVKIIMESSFDSTVFGGSYCFSDVGSEWFAKYICAAYTLGIVGGHPDGSFKPGDFINLAEALKILLEEAAEMAGFYIEDVPGVWYQKYMDVANAMGILDTINSDPEHLLTRGEMAELLYQVDMLSYQP